MANKKLKVELELETAKAKQKLDDMANTGGGGPSGPSPVDDAARKTAREIKALGEETGKCQVNMKGAVKAFAGMGVGMAASYAANYLEEGSMGKTITEYASSIFQGAAAGAMAGSVIPGVGTLAGGIVGGGIGATKQFFDNSGKEKSYTDEFKRSEREYADNKAWIEFMKSVNNLTAEKKSYAARISQAKDMLEVYKDAEEALKSEVESLIALKKTDEANRKMGKLVQNRSRQEALSSSIFAMEEASKNDGVRGSFAALDAISRVGGNMFGEGGRGDETLRVEREQVELLKSIDRKTGAAVWQ